MLPPDSGEPMTEYPAYTSDGHFTKECADDSEAMEQAEQLVDGHDVELWQRARKIATFQHRSKIQFD
jgi:hypothetical protein